jgi:hypothetical protein
MLYILFVLCCRVVTYCFRFVVGGVQQCLLCRFPAKKYVATNTEITFLFSNRCCCIFCG